MLWPILLRTSGLGGCRVAQIFFVLSTLKCFSLVQTHERMIRHTAPIDVEVSRCCGLVPTLYRLLSLSYITLTHVLTRDRNTPPVYALFIQLHSLV